MIGSFIANTDGVWLSPSCTIHSHSEIVRSKDLLGSQMASAVTQAASKAKFASNMHCRVKIVPVAPKRCACQCRKHPFVNAVHNVLQESSPPVSGAGQLCG